MAATGTEHKTHLEISGTGFAYMTVRVNGHMLACESATLEVDASGLPVLTVKLPVVDGTVVGLADPKFEIEHETRAALVAMGWTPPDGG